MAYDAGLRVVLVKLFQQFVEGVPLQLGSSVGSNTIGVKAAFVTYCYRAVVVAYGMNSPYALWKNGDNCAVAAHVIVIRRLTESFSAGVD